jgi:hypothetical protein
MQVVHVVERLERMFPALAKTMTALTAVLRATRGFDYPEFDQPKVLPVIGAGGESEIEIDADLLAAWVGHMSHSSRARMELLEDAILRSLAHSEVIAPATLTRAHIEAAAWAVYANEQLVKVAETASWRKLQSLVPKMLYGTAVAREAKHLPAEARDPLWLEATSVMNAIDALDGFFGVATGNQGATLRVLYAVLSDYAHPAIRGVRHLFEPTAETPDRWTVAYVCDERATEPEAELILKSLLTSMRLGHGASLLMRLGTIEETETGIRYVKPDSGDAMAVWQHIMLGAPSREDA